MRPKLISALLLASTGAVCIAASPLEVTDVRFWSLSEVTRIAIETNGEFHFRSDHLPNPERLFFDVLATKPRLSDKGVRVIPVDDKLLKRIRVAETQPGMTRVVLDLESAVEFTSSQLSNPDRLMIELRAAVPRAVSSSRPAPNKPAVPEEPKPVEVAAKPVPAVLERPVIAQPLEREEKPSAPAAAKLPAPPAALAAKRTSSGNRTLIRALGLKMGRVVIDPGHGGNDHGSTGHGGLMEKELVLDVAKRVGELVEENLGSEVIYTRSDDTFIPLDTRTELANEKKADLFLSIHANSSPYPNVAGVETYYLNFSSTREELDLASRENAGSEKTIYDLTDIIQKITRHDKAEESREFAAKMQSSLFNAVAKANSAVKNRGIKKAPFVVLIGATMPSILAEIGFVSNSREEALLKRPDHRQRLAEALYNGLSRYAETLSHFQVAAKN